MKLEQEQRLQRLRAGVLEWNARVALYEESDPGLPGETRKALDYRLRVLDAAIERAAEARAEEVEPLLVEAEEAWKDLLVFWHESGPEAD